MVGLALLVSRPEGASVNQTRAGGPTSPYISSLDWPDGLEEGKDESWTVAALARGMLDVPPGGRSPLAGITNAEVDALVMAIGR